MQGYQIATLDDVVETADVVITTTGNKDIILAEDMARMKHQAIVGNIGISTEIDVAGLTRTPGITRTTIKPQSTSGSSPTATRSSCSARAGCSTSATRPATRAS